jgi:ubiquinone/menaquinone biosynthesis C-methylase UbiE
MSTDERSRTWYHDHAAEYTRHVRDPHDSIYHAFYEKPAMYALLPDLHGKTVLSLGCGSGEDCQYLYSRGAAKAIGIDLSEPLITIARDSYPQCEFQVMDMEKLAFADASIDFVYSSYAIHYIEDWSEVFAEAYRVLKPNSYFLFSCTHPLFTSMQIVENTPERKVRHLSRIKNRVSNTITIEGDYMNRHALHGIGDMDVTTWHKPLSEIAGEATKAGFMIATIVEPKPQPEMETISPKDYQSLIKIPYSVIFKLFKA